MKLKPSYLKLVSALGLTAITVFNINSWALDIPVKINNKSGQRLYVDVINSSHRQALNFSNTHFDSPGQFNNTIGQNVIALPKNKVTKIKIPSQGIQGGARIYISQDPFSTHMNPVIPGMPNLATYQYIYDKIEIGWNPSGMAGWNTTAVDFFGIPMRVQLTGNGKSAVGYRTKLNGEPVTRERIVYDLQQAMQTEPNLYGERFFKQGNNGNIVRVFSPQHYYVSLPDLWQPAIEKGLKKLNKLGKEFKFTYGQFTYHDISYDQNAGTLSVYDGSQKITLSDITTGNASAGQIRYDSGIAGANFAGMISAAINRGVLGNPDKWGQSGGTNEGMPKHYYPAKNAGQYAHNTYASSLIKYGKGKKLYATSYDDFWHMDSSLQVGPKNVSGQKGVTITILPFA